MNIQQERLISLIEFAQQSALLRSNPVQEVNRHGAFHVYEHEISGLPGVRFDMADDNGGAWLAIERLQESPAPAPTSGLLKIWLELTNNPAEEPSLRSHLDTQTLLEMGALIPPEGESELDPKQLIALADYEQKDAVESQFKAYFDNLWKPWSAEEIRRRRTISLYAKLFTLKQQLEGGIVDAPVELVWGIGISVWKMADQQVVYPLLTRLVELSLNETTMAMEIQPRDAEPNIELSIYSAADNPGVVELEKIAKGFFNNAQTVVSPFNRSSFEPLLRSAVTYLDHKGIYWPNETTAEDRYLPKSAEELKITDTWVLFARPRSANTFIQDLERFKEKLESSDGVTALPDAVKALVTDPSILAEAISLPSFRGISMVYGSGGTPGFDGGKAQDIYFPMPFNDEQVQIAQRLEVYDGVVVQGPPGTGKTHTIANIICHYLALGKRVLVTSMKEPALVVLRDKLPEPIRPLAISLLTSEQEGMKQFEHAISKIASEVQGIDKIDLARRIKGIEDSIDGLHARLAKIDNDIKGWAVKNLSAIQMDGETIEPRAAAEEVARHNEATDWLEDPISVAPDYQPRFTDTDIVALREARRALGPDLDYLACQLPLIAAFSDGRELLQAHQDLARFTEMRNQVDAGQVPPLADSSRATFEAAQHLSAQISNLKLLRQAIRNANADWADAMLDRLRREARDDILELFESLGFELETAWSGRTAFLARPVEPRDGIDDQNAVLHAAIRRCAAGKRPFGIKGIVGRGSEKKSLASIQVSGGRPGGVEDWQHVLAFVEHRRSLRVLLTRWNGLADEFRLPLFPIEPAQATLARDHFSLYQKMAEATALEREVSAATQSLLPSWRTRDALGGDDQALDELQRILLHHLTQNRLAETWVLKERFQQILSGCSGRITMEIQAFLDNTLGRPEISATEIQRQWSALMAELHRVHGLKPHLETVDGITQLITASGAPLWSDRLRRKAVTTTVDRLLPNDWHTSWRVKRLATYLKSIDGRAELNRLSKSRTDTEADLARAYQNAITNRTWLKLAENATPSVKAALQAYLAAIMKIGKTGKGKKTPIYQRQAREAATLANPAIPCWIMPHYRISESLPADFEAFDLVIIDEASQSDLAALPAILRAKKILVVGDDKQVSPDGAFIDTQSIQNLVDRFLANQFPLYRAQIGPDRSIYDLFKVVFADSAIMLKEHFRCVAPIIEYSKREFYKHELKPLRLPKASERLDPPLIDVIVEDGFRKGDINPAEARYIVSEIKAIVQGSKMAGRTIGVVSLLGDKQAFEIWKMLNSDELDERGQPVGLPPDVIERHRIACGDARTFQGKERDIMFLSMVVSKGDAKAVTGRTYEQRFNVAASRARDRMYLVRSIAQEELSHADTLRRNLIAHFSSPFAQDEARVKNLRELCESDFEREVYDLLTERGYRVIPQVKFGGKANGTHEYRIDMVVEGHQDNRLAIECDGDRYHGPDSWDDDMRRQRTMERAGWRFWRCFASTFIMNRAEVVDDLLNTLRNNGIEAIGDEGAGFSAYTEQRRCAAFPSKIDEE